MTETLKYGWEERNLSLGSNFEYHILFGKISKLFREFKHLVDSYEYLLIREYFIKKNKLYFVAFNKIYYLDLNNNFSYVYDLNGITNDFNKINFLCDYSVK